MKMLVSIAASALSMIATATAFAGTVDCNTEAEVCAGPDLVWADVKCYAPEELFTGDFEFSSEESAPYFDADIMYDGAWACDVEGWLDSPKTEIKCTTALNGTGRNGSNVTVEAEMSVIEYAAEACE